MDVGILSMQRVPNYGSFLQAWALRRVLEELGGRVSFIDIEPGRQLAGSGAARVYARRAAELAGAFLKGNLGHKLRQRTYNRDMRARFAEHHKMLGTPAPFDLAVVGSDQVFNCLERTPWGFSTQLLGDVPQAQRVISYAASFGTTTFEGLHGAGVADETAAALRRLEAISVRDEPSQQVVQQLTGRQAELHLDPTLIFDFGIDDLQGGKGNYLAICSYSGSITNRAEIDALRGFARARGLRLVSLFSHYDWCDQSVIPSTPLHVLAWLRDAAFAVSDTFHGTIFSILVRSNFCAVVRPGNVARLDTLLAQLGLAGRRAEAGTLADVLSAAPDYAAAEDAIAAGKAQAREYLKKWI